MFSSIICTSAESCDKMVDAGFSANIIIGIGRGGITASFPVFTHSCVVVIYQKYYHKCQRAEVGTVTDNGVRNLNYRFELCVLGE